ncbi:AAA family ATPase [Methylobacterium sp. Leaf86]|uniref:AAA family ATPase n=1 Tax=Methylobacterium sp. Leaf86 TaxID=1736242 RepID=UPI00138F6034|nr:AAA family ATPase [Methylobacterium sp. Leaf86]
MKRIYGEKGQASKPKSTEYHNKISDRKRGIIQMIGYGITNFKAFQHTTEIDLKPLTLMFGYNSAGKSSLLRVLPFFRDAVLNRNGGPLPLKSEAIRGASFDDIRCKTSSQPVIIFEMKFRGRIQRYQITIRDIPEHKRQIVERAVVYGPDETPLMTLDWLPSDDGLSQSFESYTCTTFLSNVAHQDVLEVDFEGFIPVINYDTTDNAGYIGTVVLLRRALERSTSNIYWLKALRCVPSRQETFDNVPERMKPDGSGASQILAYNDLHGSEVLQDVVSWYKRATGSLFEIKKGAFLGTDLISATLAPLEAASATVALTDTGEGMGQVLPILTLLALARHRKLGDNPLLAVEHPELHLHPSAHPSLADLFCEAASIDSPPNIIVETHSENFLLAVQLSIIEGRLPASSVVIYWVRYRNETAIAEKIEFDTLGRPKGDNWPPGLFNESTEQSRKIILARKKQQKL